MLVGVATLLTVPWILVAAMAMRGGSLANASTRVPSDSPGSSAARAAPTTSPASLEIRMSQIGPWGQMQIVPIVLELPDEYLPMPTALDRLTQWNFTGHTRAEAMDQCRLSGFTESQLSELGEANWNEADGRCVVYPPDPLVMSLSAETRSRLYRELALDKANTVSVDPYWFRPGRVDFRFRGSDLSSKTMEVFKRLLYPGGENVLLFADVLPAMRAIGDPIEQRKFARALTRKRALMARLLIDLDTDTNALADYWGARGRRKDVLPILNSLKYNVVAGIERPAGINVIALLPPFARERLYNHADAGHASPGLKEDCFWSAFNFFADQTDDRVNDMDYLATVLQRDYYKIDAPTQVGDVVLVADDSGNAIHAANYIADDVVFTKNGISITQPWILQSMNDMLEAYRIKSRTLKVVYFRKR